LEKRPKSEWILLPDTTPPIISKELWDRVQEIRQQNRDMNKARATHQYVLRSHVRCGHCGSPLVGSFMNHRFRYYHCRGTYDTAAREKVCNAKYIRADFLENEVWKKIRQALEKRENALAGINEQIEA
jgi:site-specific DNA recombinase